VVISAALGVTPISENRFSPFNLGPFTYDNELRFTFSQHIVESVVPKEIPAIPTFPQKKSAEET